MQQQQSMNRGVWVTFSIHTSQQTIGAKELQVVLVSFLFDGVFQSYSLHPAWKKVRAGSCANNVFLKSFGLAQMFRKT